MMVTTAPYRQGCAASKMQQTRSGPFEFAMQFSARSVDWKNPLRWPLTLRVLLGVVLGITTGLVLRELNDDVRTAISDRLELIGKLVVRLLVMLATPLIFFAIIDAFATTHLSGRQGLKLLFICALNVSFAFAIGLTIMNVARPGDAWEGHWRPMLDEMQSRSSFSKRQRDPLASLLVDKKVITEEELRHKEDEGHTVDPFRFTERTVPTSFLKPFVENTLLQVVLLAILAGLALRQVHEHGDQATRTASETVVRFVSVVFQLLMKMLHWIIQLVPLAVFGMLAQVVSKFGLEAFSTLWVFFVTIMAGLALHALGYYSFAVWWWSGRKPWTLLQKGGDAILTGLFTNSSLATVPITLRALTQRMGVSESSARLSACVGTNFNNDGITLYEAMAALFLAQALGQNLSFTGQCIVLLTSIMAAISITGIPEAGIIVLPLVLSAAGMKPDDVAACLILLLPLDVIIARVRSAVNVMGDMTVAIMLDGKARHTTTPERT